MIYHLCFRSNRNIHSDPPRIPNLFALRTQLNNHQKIRQIENLKICEISFEIICQNKPTFVKFKSQIREITILRLFARKFVKLKYQIHEITILKLFAEKFVA